MTVLLGGRFREFLKSETQLSQLEIRKCRESIRRLAISYDNVREVPVEELSDREIEALMLFRRYRQQVALEAGEDARREVDHIDFYFLEDEGCGPARA